MTLPLLNTKPTTQNHRVTSVAAVPTIDRPRVWEVGQTIDEQDFQAFLYAAYRQVFSEHLIVQSNRQTDLESQLRNGSISVQSFIRGLGKSEVFQRLVYDANNNYRFVEVCLKRFLGRAPYNKQETINMSIIVAQKGYPALIDALIDSAEYQENFGTKVIPYQRQLLSKPYNLTTPRLAFTDQGDQRKSWQSYTGPKFLVGWQAVIEEYTTPTPVQAGDSKQFLDLALSFATKSISGPKVSVWDIKIPDMTRSGR